MARASELRASEFIDDGGPAYPSLDYSRSLGKSYIFLASLFLSVVAWLISLISQAFVTAHLGNGSIGTLWFGIILQLGVILGLVHSLFSDTLFQYGISIAIFAALATSFGAQGVNLNVFFGTSAQKAVAAGWIITCIVDVVWILILSSEPSSFVYRYVATNGRVRNHPMQANGAVQNVSTNLDAFAQKYNTGVPSEHPQQSVAPGSMAGSMAGSGGVRMSGVRGNSGVDPEAQKRRSAGIWSTPPQTPGGAGSMRDVPPVPESAANDPPVELSDIGAGTRATSDSNVDPNRPASTSRTTTDVTPMPQGPPRALALFDYTASPADAYEISFKKGEVLDVIDSSGKWWEAIKADGSKGIAPSNYLKLM